ncbi:MAG: signal peptide peptidase SppA [Bacteroidales bacterium]|jgi:protease-4|nr:signal peptide peptidase SppA [Bacteroidales bacterium]MDD2686858.1 signal peptide peptidase SppA [Bacteroidales bacterium]MDD4044007.1 signal peptide peptidase SppA [Bacteroidales bacterium]MDD4581058.1 signal peptide peptidase SppA [Bacteroidales bacterium]
MKSFFKAVLATIVGILFLWILLFITFLSIGIASLTPSHTPVKSNSVLVLDLNGIINERSIDNPFENVYGNTSPKTIGLNTILNLIKKAATDNNIKGISLQANYILTNYASIEEIRNALLDFRKTGKFVYSYSETMAQNVYYLATAADSIFIHPQGNIEFKGLVAEVLFFNKLLKKLDVDAQIIRHGEFKNAVEPFILDKMSNANREQMQSYVNSTWNNICNAIHSERGIEIETINRIADSLLFLYNPPLALSEKFIDVIAYRDEYDAFLKHKLQVEASRDYNRISIKDYKKTILKDNTAPHKIAVIYANGNIIDDEGNYENIGFNIANEIKKAREEKSIKAIVLRINSGGGSALMSDIIWREVFLTNKEKPIVVSMSDYAASGGYYIACAANYIVAQPSTLTGSIGVFGIIPNVEKFLSNKIGITTDHVKTNLNSDAISITHAMNNYEKLVMQKNVENVYNTFVNHVSEGRDLSFSEVDAIAQGRIWTGSDAYKIGLVDTLGGLDLAIQIAADKAKMKNYSIIEQPLMKDFFELLTTSLFETSTSNKIKFLKFNNLYPYYEYWETIHALKGIQTRLPFILTIK